MIRHLQANTHPWMRERPCRQMMCIPATPHALDEGQIVPVMLSSAKWFGLIKRAKIMFTKQFKSQVTDESTQCCWLSLEKQTKDNKNIVLTMYVCVSVSSHPPLVLTGGREKPRPVFLTEVDDLKRKHITGCCFLCCSHHSVGDTCYMLKQKTHTAWLTVKAVVY